LTSPESSLELIMTQQSERRSLRRRQFKWSEIVYLVLFDMVLDNADQRVPISLGLSASCHFLPRSLWLHTGPLRIPDIFVPERV
jgi:hypothetical protein